MRPSRTITISLPPDLAADMDRVALAERRTRSELMREAFRRYLASQSRWDRLFTLGAEVTAAKGLTDPGQVDEEVDRAVADVRRRRSLPR